MPCIFFRIAMRTAGDFARIDELRPGFAEVFSAEVKSADSVSSKGGRRFFEAVVGDDSGAIVTEMVQFQSPIHEGDMENRQE